MNPFLNAIASYLDSLDVGIFDTDSGRNIFVNVLPPDPNECIALLGLPGDALDDSRDVAEMQFPRFQAFVRSDDSDDGFTLFQSVRESLHGKLNLKLPSSTPPYWRILRMHVDQEGGPIGQDDQGRYEFSVNFTTQAHFVSE